MLGKYFSNILCSDVYLLDSAVPVAVPAVVVANVANNVAYIDEPIAPVSSFNEPTAPNNAPASPSGAKLANNACIAGIATPYSMQYVVLETEKGRTKKRKGTQQLVS